MLRSQNGAGARIPCMKMSREFLHDFAFPALPFLCCAHARRAVAPSSAALQIFNRQGVPLFYREWARPAGFKDMREEHKLMFGVLFSLKQLVGKMSPKKYASAASHTSLDPLLSLPNAFSQGWLLLLMQHKRLPAALL